MDNLKKTFNSQTSTGRANVAKATYASFAFIYLYYRFFKKNKTTSEIKAHENHASSSSSSNHEEKDEFNYNQQEPCPSCGESACQNSKEDDPPIPDSSTCRTQSPDPFPNKPPTACPPNCKPETAPSLPREEGQCTCQYIQDRDCTDPERRNLNPFLNDMDDDEIW